MLNCKSDLRLQYPSLSRAYLDAHDPMSHLFTSYLHLWQFGGHAVNRKTEHSMKVHITSVAYYNVPCNSILTNNIFENKYKHTSICVAQ